MGKGQLWSSDTKRFRFVFPLSGHLKPAEKKPSHPCMLSKLLILERKHQRRVCRGVRDTFRSDLLFTGKGNRVGCRGWSHAARRLLLNCVCKCSCATLYLCSFECAFTLKPRDLHKCSRANCCLSNIPLHSPLHAFISASIPLHFILLIVPVLKCSPFIFVFICQISKTEFPSTQLLKI